MSESKNRGRVTSVKTAMTPDTASIFFGKEPGSEMASVHVYAKSYGDLVDFLEFKIEDLVDAFNNIPGVTATIDSVPEPDREPTNYETVLDLPVGSVFKWSTGDDSLRYIKVADDKIIHLFNGKVYDGYCPEDFNHSDGDYSIVVIYKPEV